MPACDLFPFNDGVPLLLSCGIAEAATMVMLPYGEDQRVGAFVVLHQQAGKGLVNHHWDRVSHVSVFGTCVVEVTACVSSE